ncbi:hypothetical protein HQ533_00865 [Candidatus Woesearchaeota archaeon]|nr:hypothetical protein [Candidatus Woesearchaeota archaeon]
MAKDRERLNDLILQADAAMHNAIHLGDGSSFRVSVGDDDISLMLNYGAMVMNLEGDYKRAVRYKGCDFVSLS